MQLKITFIIPLASGSQRGDSWDDLFTVTFWDLLGFMDLSVTELAVEEGHEIPKDHLNYAFMMGVWYRLSGQRMRLFGNTWTNFLMCGNCRFSNS